MAELGDLAAQMPMLVRGFMLDGWRPAAEAPRERSQAAFLAQVAARYDGREPRRTTRAVLAVLARRVSAGEIEDIQQVLPQALEDLWPQTGSAVLLEEADHPAGGADQPLANLMSRKLLTSTADAMLLEVLARMEHARVRHLIIVKPSALASDEPAAIEAVQGILTTRDAVTYLRRHPHDATRLDELTVRDVMTPAPLHTARAQADVGAAAALMRRERVSALPVLDASGVLVGMVTADDLLGALKLAPTA